LANSDVPAPAEEWRG